MGGRYRRISQGGRHIAVEPLCCSSHASASVMAETSNSNVPTTTPANFSRTLIEEFQYLTEKLDILYQTYCAAPEKKRCPSKARLADKFNIIENALNPLYLVNVNADAPMKEADPPADTRPKRKRKRRRGVVSNPLQAKQSVPQLKECRSIRNSDETKEPRYILLSNGCAVWLLDLKMSTDQPLTKKADVLPPKKEKKADVQPLPKIAMLNLIEENLPVSVGLFKLGSEAYMIGGQRVSAEDLKSGYTPFLSNSVKGGTSRATYRLSRAEKGTLSHSKCKKLKLKRPKFWPIVEEIGENIHVFDYAPFKSRSPGDGWFFSHEVLEKDDGCWRKIPKSGVAVVDGIIRSHTVIGNCIYAVGNDGRFLVFNSETEKWEKKGPGLEYRRHMDAFNAETVWDILRRGIVRCVGEFILEEPAISERVYMLIGMVPSYKRNSIYSRDDLHAIAYLVTSMGKVVCKQRLTDFFQGPMKPISMSAGTMFDVDKAGKTMCCVVYGEAFYKGKAVNNNGRDYIFINTFSVEQLGGAAKDKEVKDIINLGYLSGALLERKFVEVGVRSSYVHGPDADAVAAAGEDGYEDARRKEGDLIHFVDMQACCF